MNSGSTFLKMAFVNAGISFDSFVANLWMNKLLQVLQSSNESRNLFSSSKRRKSLQCVILLPFKSFDWIEMPVDKSSDKA